MKTIQAAPFDDGSRRRTISACTTCRDRRIKCDRTRPTCLQCKKRGRTCKYSLPIEPSIEFVAETPGSTQGNVVAERDTWSSVIEQQAALARKEIFNSRKPEALPESSSWILEEWEQPYIPSGGTLHSYDLKNPQFFIPIGTLGERYLSKLFNAIPSQDECRPLWESFLLGIHPIVPICHVSTLEREYLTFWATFSPNTPLELLVLILAILYTGAANAPLDVSLLSVSLLELYDELFNIIDFSSYQIRHPASAIQLFQGYVIMNTFKARQLAPFSAFGFLPPVIRFAQTLGLHIDSKIESQIEVEIRRRIWWHLIFLDVESTISSGLPTIIRSDEYTTKAPSLFHDSKRNVADDSLHKQHNASFSPMMIALQGHFQLALRMQTWLKKAPDDEEILQFKSTIKDLKKLLLQNSSNDGENEWTRTYLEMQVDRGYCMLGLRSSQLDPLRGTGCHSEVVRTAHSFLTHYLHLSTLPSHPHFRWHVSGLVQPLHALIIMLLHLSTCSDLAFEAVRTRDLVLAIFSLRVNRIMDGGVFPEKAMIRGLGMPQRSSARYSILTTLWAKAWRNCGWATNVFDLIKKPRIAVKAQQAEEERDRAVDNVFESGLANDKLLAEEPIQSGLEMDRVNGESEYPNLLGMDGILDIPNDELVDLLQWPE